MFGFTLLALLGQETSSMRTVPTPFRVQDQRSCGESCSSNGCCHRPAYRCGAEELLSKPVPSITFPDSCPLHFCNAGDGAQGPAHTGSHFTTAPTYYSYPTRTTQHRPQKSPAAVKFKILLLPFPRLTWTQRSQCQEGLGLTVGTKKGPR